MFHSNEWIRADSPRIRLPSSHIRAPIVLPSPPPAANFPSASVNEKSSVRQPIKRGRRPKPARSLPFSSNIVGEPPVLQVSVPPISSMSDFSLHNLNEVLPPGSTQRDTSLSVQPVYSSSQLQYDASESVLETTSPKSEIELENFSPLNSEQSPPILTPAVHDGSCSPPGSPANPPAKSHTVTLAPAPAPDSELDPLAWSVALARAWATYHNNIGREREALLPETVLQLLDCDTVRTACVGLSADQQIFQVTTSPVTGKVKVELTASTLNLLTNHSFLGMQVSHCELAKQWLLRGLHWSQ